MSAPFGAVPFLLLAICKQYNLSCKCLKYKFNIIHILLYLAKYYVRNVFEVTLLLIINIKSTFRIERCKFNKKIMNNGKILEVLRKNAHWIIISFGVLVGVTACVYYSKSGTELVVKNNKITISKTK